MTERICLKSEYIYKAETSAGMTDPELSMKMFRCGFRMLGGMEVENIREHSSGYACDEIEYRLAGGSSVKIKTSGTHPELTVCMDVVGKNRKDAEERETRIREDIENIIYMDLRAGYCCE